MATSAPITIPTAVIHATTLLEWMIPAIGKFPRHLRFGIGQRIEGALSSVVEELVIAQYEAGQERAHALRWANRRLQVAKHFIRVCVTLRALSERQHAHVAEMTVKLGQEIGGWRKASEKTANSSPNSAMSAD